MPPDDPQAPTIAPPAVQAWKQKEEAWRKEAYSWAKSRLLEHFQSDRGFTPVTAADLLHMLDQFPDMPTGWAMHLKTDTVSYKARYSIVRNTLEVLARQRHLQMGTKVNAKGQERVTTYARPRDANAEWNVQIEGTPQAIKRAQEGIRDWLSLDGSVLDGVDSMRFVRVAHRQGVASHGFSEESDTESAITHLKRRTGGRKPRATGGDNE